MVFVGITWFNITMGGLTEENYRLVARKVDCVGEMDIG